MPTRLRTVIVDDEDLARAILKEYLATHPEIEIIAECSNGFDAVKAIAENKPDLLFLDIQMPKLSGFEVLELVAPPPAVIFVTAFDDYALQAFEVHAVDYLLKPVSQERFDEALCRAEHRLKEGNAPSVGSLLADVQAAARPVERILVKDGARVHVIPVDRIDYLEAQDDYVCLKCGDKEYLKPQPLSQVEATLDPDRFVRIHRCYVLNVQRIIRLELYAKDSRLAVLSDGKRLPVSRAGYQRLKSLFGSEL
jgi:two-component system LytT family response regulator